MPKINFELSMAALIPDFIYQFLMSGSVGRENITCVELEDLRDAVYSADLPELEKIREFLAIEKTAPEEGPEDDEERAQAASDALDAELAEVDSEYYHKYTPGEIRFIFEEIIENIDLVYGIYREYAGMNLSLAIDFKFKEGPESNMIIEFLELSETPEYLEDVYFLPIKNYLVSDSVIARVYFNFEAPNRGGYDTLFAGALDSLSLKNGNGQREDLH